MKKLMLFVLLSLVFGCLSNPGAKAPDSPNNIPQWVREGGIYEVFVRNATSEGTFKALEDQLPRIKALGIKTLWFMPIHPIGQIERKGTYGSPYSIQDFFNVDPNYGTLSDFQDLVKTAHALEMKVILDLVANHTAWDNSWVKDHPDWYLQDKDGQIIPPIPEWSDVAALNFYHQEVQDQIFQVMLFWIEEMHVDGFRFDAVEFVPLEYWMEYLPLLVQRNPQVLLLAEGANEVLTTQGPFHMLYSWPGYGVLKALWEGRVSGRDYLYAAYGEWAAAAFAPPLRFITNHDETSWDQNPVDLFGGAKGSQGAAVAGLLVPGIPMIYNGQEIGSQVDANLFEKTVYDWNTGREFQNFYSRLLHLWKGNKAFTHGDMIIPSWEGEKELILFSRVQGDQAIHVFVNSSPSKKQISWPEGWDEKEWENLWTGEELKLPSQAEAYQWLIFQ